MDSLFSVPQAALFVLLLQACAARTVPTEVPDASPASTNARPGAVADVTVALDGDPPLPGEANDRWPGLAAQSDAIAGGGHGSHHQHDQHDQHDQHHQHHERGAESQGPAAPEGSQP